MARPIVYSTGLCPYCFMAKRLLERRGVAFEERRLRRSERGRLAPLGGGLTYPQIVFGERSSTAGRSCGVSTRPASWTGITAG